VIAVGVIAVASGFSRKISLGPEGDSVSSTTEIAQLTAAAERIAAAIGRRDLSALRGLLAPGFVHRTHGGDASDADAFLEAIAAIPGDIRFVNLVDVAIDVCPAGALVTGVQHAQVAVGDAVLDDRRGFVDWFVRVDGEWRIQAAVDLPASAGAQ
jgi:hypothetical protein